MSAEAIAKGLVDQWSTLARLPAVTKNPLPSMETISYHPSGWSPVLSYNGACCYLLAGVESVESSSCLTGSDTPL